MIVLGQPGGLAGDGFAAVDGRLAFAERDAIFSKPGGEGFAAALGGCGRKFRFKVEEQGLAGFDGGVGKRIAGLRRGSRGRRSGGNRPGSGARSSPVNGQLTSQVARIVRSAVSYCPVRSLNESE